MDQPTLRDTDVDPEASAVFVNWVVLEEDLWTAVWQRGEAHRSFSGPRHEALEWALAQPAERYWIFSAEADDFVPLTR